MILQADNQPAAALGEFDTKNSADRGSTPRTSTLDDHCCPRSEALLLGKPKLTYQWLNAYFGVAPTCLGGWCPPLKGKQPRKNLCGWSL